MVSKSEDVATTNTSLVQPMSIDFPRGGANTLTPLETRQVMEQAIADFDAGLPLIQEGEQQSKGAKKRTRNKEKFSASIPTKKPKTESVDMLTFKKLNLGMSLLGSIKEINELDLVLSLPNQMTGFVSITEISNYITKKVESAAGESDEEDEGEEPEIPDLKTLFCIGQLVPCTIVTLEDSRGADKSRRRIELSLRAEIVNASLRGAEISPGMMLIGSISSEQDHVYQVDLGFAGHTGILMKKHAKKYLKSISGELLHLGQPILVQVLSANAENKTISLTLDPELIEKTAISKDDNLSFEQLKPGYLLNVKIKTVLDSGLYVTFQDIFNLTVDVYHLGHVVKDIDTDIASKFTEGQKVKCRVIFIDVPKKRIGVSMKSDILSLSRPSAATLEIGSKMQMIVVRVDKDKGIVLVDSDDSSVVGYAHKSRISDTENFKISAEYAVGTAHPARIISQNPFDAVYSVSLQPSVLSQAFIRHADLAPGQTVKNCKIVRLTVKGMVVSVTDSITGFIPTLHMSDVILRDPSKLFKVGGTVKCQVLSCDSAERRLLLTCKKSLIGSTLPKLTLYEDIEVGAVACGVINGFVKDAAFVSFYNDVKGYVHISEMGDDFIKSPSQNHRIGQTVKCRVLSIREQDLKISFKIGKNTESIDVTPGQIVSAVILSKAEGNIIVKLDTGELKASLPFAHLTDVNSATHSSKLASCLKEGQVLSECLVISVDKRRGEILLTRKPSLLAFSKGSDAVNTVSQVQVGTTLPGYIKKILVNGCIVGFVGKCQGFARMHSISDTYVSNINDHVTIGQSVISKINEVDTEQGRLTVNLKNSVNFPTNTPKPSAYESQLLESLFIERDWISAEVLSKSDCSQDLKDISFKLTDELTGTVQQLLPYGARVEIDGKSQIIGLITSHQFSGKTLKVGDKVLAKVLDFDIEKKIVDLTLMKVCKPLSKTVTKKVDAKIEMIKEDYLIASIPSLNNAIVFVTVNTFNSIESPFSKYKDGQTINILVTKVPPADANGFHALKVIAVPRTIASTAKYDGIDMRRKLVSPIDPRISLLDDVLPGLNIKVRVKSVKSNQINVELASNLYGRIHVCELVDSITELVDFEKPLKSFLVGDIIDVKVVGFHDVKTNTYLPISKKTSVSSLVVDLTLKKSDMALPDGQLANAGASRHASYETVVTGEEFDGFIQKVSADSIWVYISPILLARTFIFECADSCTLLKSLESNFKIGQAVKCRLISKDDAKKSLDLTFKIAASSTLVAGHIVPGRVSSTNTETGLNVQVSAHVYGRVHLTDISDNFSKKPTVAYKRGDWVDCFVLSRKEDVNQLDLSLRESRLSGNVVDGDFPEIRDISDVKSDMLIQGFVKNTSESGCFVSINSKITARVKICDLSDMFIKDWKVAFSRGKLVSGRVLSVNLESGRVELSLKQSAIDPSSVPKSVVTIESISVGDKIRGTVSKIERYGAFIKFDNSKISGLCHIKEMSDEEVSDIGKLFSVGDVVKSIVLEVDRKLRRISLGLKPSYFTSDDAMDIDNDDAASVQGDEFEQVSDADSDDDVVMDTTIPATPLETVESKPTSSIHSLMGNAAPLDLDSENEDIQSQASDSDNESVASNAGSIPKRLTRKEKKRIKRDLETATVEKEMLIASGDAAPESADDYERLLLGSPNSSFLWIKYMAYEFQLAEIDKARGVAERALKNISFREEKEKMNVWVAYMNLEFSYGTPESLKKVFDRAVAGNEPKSIFIQLSQIYCRSQQQDLAISLYETMLKKFKHSSKVWSLAGLYYLQQGKIEESRQTLQKSLKSLPKHKHVKTINKFAQYEFKHGEPERGRTIYEGVMSKYPKRVDLWNVYLDMEIRAGDVSIIRRLFERVISMSFSSKKMKSFFKKYLEFEKSLEDDGLTDHVKEAALAYVESLQKT